MSVIHEIRCPVICGQKPQRFYYGCGGQCSLLWLNAKIRFSLRKFSDHLLKYVRYFTTGGGHSLLWPDASTFLNHIVASSRPGDAIIACSKRPHGLLNPNLRHFEKVCEWIINPTFKQ